MFYFKNRNEMRAFAVKTGKQRVDLGSNAPAGRRWAVKVL